MDFFWQHYFVSSFIILICEIRIWAEWVYKCCCCWFCNWLRFCDWECFNFLPLLFFDSFFLIFLNNRSILKICGYWFSLCDSTWFSLNCWWFCFRFEHILRHGSSLRLLLLLLWLPICFSQSIQDRITWLLWFWWLNQLLDRLNFRHCSLIWWQILILFVSWGHHWWCDFSFWGWHGFFHLSSKLVG